MWLCVGRGTWRFSCWNKFPTTLAFQSLCLTLPWQLAHLRFALLKMSVPLACICWVPSLDQAPCWKLCCYCVVLTSALIGAVNSSILQMTGCTGRSGSWPWWQWNPCMNSVLGSLLLEPVQYRPAGMSFLPIHLRRLLCLHLPLPMLAKGTFFHWKTVTNSFILSGAPSIILSNMPKSYITQHPVNLGICSSHSYCFSLFKLPSLFPLPPPSILSSFSGYLVRVVSFLFSTFSFC